eukprot:6201125-Pleurochrysis_carterae.AAC.4
MGSPAMQSCGQCARSCDKSSYGDDGVQRQMCRSIPVVTIALRCEAYIASITVAHPSAVPRERPACRLAVPHAFSLTALSAPEVQLEAQFGVADVTELPTDVELRDPKPLSVCTPV